MLVSAMPMQSAVTQDEVCPGVAPRCLVASTMMASVLPKPTTVATRADAINENCNPGPPPTIVTRPRLTVTPHGAHRRLMFRYFEDLIRPTAPVRDETPPAELV